MTRTFAALVAAALVACVEGSSQQPVVATNATAATCPRARPSGCATKRSLTTDATPILQKHCFRCHAPGSSSFAAEDHDFTSEKTVRAQRARVLSKVAACVMPPDRPQEITPEEATVLMEWAACGD
jgi:uncharacterized membrane protein